MKKEHCELRKITYQGVKYTYAQVAEMHGLKATGIEHRARNGWTDTEIYETPARGVPNRIKMQRQGADRKEELANLRQESGVEEIDVRSALTMSWR